MNFKILASGSSGNAYVIDDGQSKILVDAGISLKRMRAKLGYSITEASFALISHSHGDHAAYVKELLRLGLDCWMSIETAKALGVEGTHRIGEGERVRVGTWTVDAFATVHDCPGSLGFVVTNQQGEKLLYATDTQYLRPVFHGLSIIALEANYSMEKIRENVQAGDVDRMLKHRTIWNHQSIDTVLKFLQATDRSRLQQVVLLHLSDANADEADFKRKVQELCGCPVLVA